MSGIRIVIVGAGFGGLQAAKKLTGHGFHITLVDRHNYHLFQPLLYQVATAGLEPEHVAKPVRAIMRGRSDVTFLMSEVERIDLGKRRIVTSREILPYDFLILAAGAETHSFGIPGIEANAIPLKTLGDAVNLRNHILRAFERASTEHDPQARLASLNFTIVGGGSTGVEMAGALAELIQHVMPRDFPELDFDQVVVTLIEAKPRLLEGMDEELAQSAVEVLAGKGVRVRLSTKVLSYDGSRLELDTEIPIYTKNVIWAAGVRASSLTRGLEVDHGQAGRVLVEETLQLPGHPEVFVIGDAACPMRPGDPPPMMAPVAQQMAEVAASNIVRLQKGQQPIRFHYRDPGRLATIGRNAAVAQIGRFEFKGFVAWVVWLVVHLLRLVGFRNRLMVFLSWLWEYLFYDRAVRLIDED